MGGATARATVLRGGRCAETRTIHVMVKGHRSLYWRTYATFDQVHSTASSTIPKESSTC